MTLLASAATASTRPQHPRIDAGVTVAGLDPEALVRDHGSPLYVYDLDVITERVGMLRAAVPGGGRAGLRGQGEPVTGHPAAAGGSGRRRGHRLGRRAGHRDPCRVRHAPGDLHGPGQDRRRAGGRHPGGRPRHHHRVAGRARCAARAGAPGGSAPGPGAAAHGRGGESGRRGDAHHRRRRRLQVRPAARGAGRGGRPAAAGGCHRRPGSPYELLGLHAFGASNVRDADRLLDGIRWVAAQAQDVAQRHGQRFRLLDAGGGLGIPYADDEAPLDLRAAGRRHRGGARHVVRPGPGWPTRGCCSSRAGSWSARRAPTSRAWCAPRPAADARWPSPTAASTTCCGRPWWGRRSASWPSGEAARRTGLTPSSVVGPLCTGLDVLVGRGVAARPPDRATCWPCWIRAPTASRSRCPCSCPTRCPRRSPCRTASRGWRGCARSRDRGRRVDLVGLPVPDAAESRVPGPQRCRPRSSPVRAECRTVPPSTTGRVRRTLLWTGTMGRRTETGLEPIARDPSTGGEKGSPPVGHLTSTPVLLGPTSGSRIRQPGARRFLCPGQGGRGPGRPSSARARDDPTGSSWSARSASLHLRSGASDPYPVRDCRIACGGGPATAIMRSMESLPAAARCRAHRGGAGRLLTQHLGLTRVAGQIAAGLIIGPSVLGLVQLDGASRCWPRSAPCACWPSPGLETDVVAIRKVGRPRCSRRSAGSALPFILGAGDHPLARLRRASVPVRGRRADGHERRRQRSHPPGAAHRADPRWARPSWARPSSMTSWASWSWRSWWAWRPAPPRACRSASCWP